MKVLGLSGSMRKEGNTAQLIQVILGQCKECRTQNGICLPSPGRRSTRAWAA